MTLGGRYEPVPAIPIDFITTEGDAAPVLTVSQRAEQCLRHVFLLVFFIKERYFYEDRVGGEVFSLFILLKGVILRGFN
jgi:hypothetical protein